MRIRFVDVDDTITRAGEDMPYEGVVRTLRDWAENGDQIWLFTCRPPDQRWIQALQRYGVPVHGFIHKPLADEYTYHDDKLVVEDCGTEIPGRQLSAFEDDDQV